MAASVAAIYFLYEALAHDGPWIYFFWSVAAGLVARQTTTSIYDTKQRLDYVAKLVERGYMQVDAESAWRVARNGGMNMLRNMHQIELADEIERLESELGIRSAGGAGD